MKTFLDGLVTLHEGDCLDVVRGLADNSIDSVVTDPPYALVSIVKRFGKTSAEDDNDTGKRSKSGADGYARLAKGFMGKEWDNGSTAFAVEFWAEVMRVLKPGGHVAAFGGTRSYHRLACAIEDAGFEIRDQLAWVYGQGFPKSHDVSKGIDRALGADREVVETKEVWGNNAIGGRGGQLANGFAGHADGSRKTIGITAPATYAARQWEGWGTALKPSWEPICLARKPLSERTVAANVLRWGTGAINVGVCRIETTDTLSIGSNNHKNAEVFRADRNAPSNGQHALGRWPANLCHDGSDEVLAAFPDSISGEPRESTGSRNRQMTGFGMTDGNGGYGDSGSAARFFYSAKADSDDRIGSKHPTVKPVDLMQWLVRLITPPKGTVLDPFSGTGTTGEAAWREGFNAVLIEREPEYQADIERRMKYALGGSEERKHVIIKAKGKTEHAGPLFDFDVAPQATISAEVEE